MRELGGRGSADAAVRSDLIEVLLPDRCGNSGLLQCCKPAFIEMLMAEFNVEALDKPVLHRSPWLNQDVSNAMVRAHAVNILLVNSGPLSVRATLG